MKRTIKDLINTEGLEYSEYVISERALPSLIDGLKPSQRYFLYSCIRNANNTFKKIAAISGVVSEYGYNHAETAILDTGAAMANTWANNYPIVLGRGNFGSRSNRDAAAPRYIFAKIDENFEHLFVDNDLLPSTKKGSELPEFYLPIIPYVLLNGTSGIAVGYATDIPPHCPKSVAEQTITCIKNGSCDNALISFPEFIGTVDQEERTISGRVELKSKYIARITELPPQFDRVTYIKLLDKLVDSSKIVSYDDLCGTEFEFEFEVKLKRDKTYNEKDLMNLFDLTKSFKYNINVILSDGKRKTYKQTKDLIRDFVDYRITFYPIRIQKRIDEFTEKYELANEKLRFIDEFNNHDLDKKLKGFSKKKAIEYLNELNYNRSELLIGLPIHQITLDEVDKLKKLAKEYHDTLIYWQNTTAKAEFIKDVETFLKYLNSKK